MIPDRTPQQEALDPATSAKRLREIWQELYNVGRISEVAEAMAVHANMPPNLLAVLANAHSKAVLQNPALPRILQKDPKWARSLQPDAARKMLRFENVPPQLLHALAARPEIAAAARLHIGLAGEAGQGWEQEAREALWDALGIMGWSDLFPVRFLTLDLVPEWLLEPLAAHSDSRVRRAVARSPRTPAVLLAPLRRAGSTSDLGGLAPPDLSLPPPVLERLARGGPWAKRLAARHPSTPPDVLEQLVAGRKARLWGNDEILCRCLVRNPNTPADLQALLAAEFNAEFRRASARDPETPPLALADLSLSEVRDVRWMAARNPSTPVEALEVLAADTDPRVRQGVGRNAAAPPPLLARLAADPVRWVRLAAARHPLTPPDALAVLAKDSDEEVRQSATRRFQSVPAAPRLPKPPRRAPPLRPGQLSAPADPAERAQALKEAEGNCGLPAKIAALACPDTSPWFLALGARDEFWPKRLAVARNPAAFLLSLAMPGAEADLHSLAHDGNRFVRAAARAALQPMEDNTLP